jgi:hypothetical protein
MIGIEETVETGPNDNEIEKNTIPMIGDISRVNPRKHIDKPRNTVDDITVTNVYIYICMYLLT